jgi:methanogenic corrinoid protein MtbC1
MASAHRLFSSSLLDQSAAGYAALAADRLFEKLPTLEARYGASSRSEWRASLGQRIHELAIAVEFQAPALFADVVHWARESFVARELPDTDLEAGLVCLRAVLHEELPANVGLEVAACLEPALAVFSTPRGASRPLDPRAPWYRLILSYIEACVSGDARGATQMILDAVGGGLGSREACLEVLVPAQTEVGRLWHAGKLSIHEEHCVTATTRTVLSLLAERTPPGAALGKTVVGATVQGNAHELAVRVVTFLFEAHGWRAIALESELPPEEVARSMRDFDADLAALSAAMIVQLPALRDSVHAIRELSPRTKIVVGGQAFAAAPDVWRRVGADALSQRAEDVVRTGAQLVG